MGQECECQALLLVAQCRHTHSCTHAHTHTRLAQGTAQQTPTTYFGINKLEWKWAMLPRSTFNFSELSFLRI